MLEQERDDVFTLQVGNIIPGEHVEITITYSERLPFFENGTTEIRLPMVVAPRYVPGNPLDSCEVGDGIEEDTDIVPDASRISPPRLAKGFDPKVGLNIQVELLSDAAIRELSCSQHATRTSNSGGNGISVSLSRTDELLNRDFVLRWNLGENKIQTAFHGYKSEHGTYYAMLSILPPQREHQSSAGRDVVFVLDRSGSMRGVKMASASKACAILLSTLGPADRFAIACFNTAVKWFYPNGMDAQRFLTADESGVKRGEGFLRGITSEGGTELDQALESGLEVISRRDDGSTRVPVVVLLTDGQISDEGRVLARIQKEIGSSRIFTVGIDTAVNQGFLSRLAALGKGTSTFVEPGASLDDALRTISREIGAPMIVDVRLEDLDSNINMETISPARIPDLFAGRSSVTFFQMNQPGRIRINGKFSDGSNFEETISSEVTPVSAIAHLWARARVRDLEDQFRLEPALQEQTKKKIIEIGIRHTLLTRFTAFVVVDESKVVNQDGTRRKIVQPVEMPAQWEMEMGSPMHITGAMAMMSLPSAPLEARASAPAPMMQFDERSRPSSLLKGLFRKHTRDVDPKQKPADSKALKEAVKDFMKAFDGVQKAIESGQVPSGKQLEKTRKQLIKLMPDTGEYAALGRLLNGVVTELLTALRSPGIEVSTLQSILNQNKKTIDEAFREVQPTAFWESTI